MLRFRLAIFQEVEYVEHVVPTGLIVCLKFYSQKKNLGSILMMVSARKIFVNGWLDFYPNLSFTTAPELPVIARTARQNQRDEGESGE